MTFSKHTLHANSVVFNQKGLLILGESGMGKSDLSLRLIDNGGILISDDYTILTLDNTKDMPELYASSPDNITGFLEIRGLGIMIMPYIKNHKIDYVIELVTDYPRIPEITYCDYNTIRLRKFLLNPFELSVLNKIHHIVNTPYESILK